MLFDCATNRHLREANYKYVFRTTTMATQENVRRPRYIAESFPNLKPLGGHPNSPGARRLADFTEAMKSSSRRSRSAQRHAQARRGASTAPKFPQWWQRSRDRADSLWGGDLAAFILQRHRAAAGAPALISNRLWHNHEPVPYVESVNRRRTPKRP